MSSKIRSAVVPRKNGECTHAYGSGDVRAAAWPGNVKSSVRVAGGDKGGRGNDYNDTTFMWQDPVKLELVSQTGEWRWCGCNMLSDGSRRSPQLRASTIAKRFSWHGRVIQGFGSGAADGCILLGYDVASTSNRIPTFRGNVVPSFSRIDRSQEPLTLLLTLEAENCSLPGNIGVRLPPDAVSCPLATRRSCDNP